MGLFKIARVLLLVPALLLAASITAFAQQQTVTIEPKKPQPGETVTITYHPDAPNAKIKKPDSLKLVFSYAPYLFFNVLEMEKIDNGWTVSHPLPMLLKFAGFYFKSGEKVDKNTKGHHFTLYVHENGIPVEGAYLWEANSLSDRYKEVSEAKIADMKAHLYAKELAVHPESFDANMEWYAFLLSQKHVDSSAIKKKAYHVINQRLKSNPGSRAVIRDVKEGYEKIGEEAKGDSVKKAIIAKYPDSDIAMYALYQKAYDVEDKDRQAEMLQKYINTDYEQTYINKFYTGIAYQKLFEYYAKKGKLEKMKHIADLWLQAENPRVLEDPIRSTDYNNAAQLIAKNTGKFSRAMEYAQKALRLTDHEPIPSMTVITKYGINYPPVSKDKKEKRLKSRKAEILATIGLIYTKQKKLNKAEETLTKAKKLSDDKTAHIYLAELYTQTSRPKMAFDIYRRLLLEEPMDEELKANLKESYIAYNGSEEGFEQKAEELDVAWREKMIAKFKEEMMDKEAPSLAHVTDLQGNPLDLSTLKNKVVVIDFWATWCGPCLSAFPYLQAVYEKYEENPNVKFIVLNSAWSNTIKDAKKWKKSGDYKENSYSFPLYYDKNSKITTAFGVRGIPTTFVLGRDGNIKFKKRGYSGPVMEPKLALRIEMLLQKEPITAGK